MSAITLNRMQNTEDYNIINLQFFNILTFRFFTFNDNLAAYPIVDDIDYCDII